MSQPAPRPPPLSRLRRASFALLTVVLALCAAEGSAALYERVRVVPERALPLPTPDGLTPELAARLAQLTRQQPATVALRPDPRLGWMPGFGKGQAGEGPNRWGLRGQDPGEGERLLSLGDSSVFGTGVQAGEVFSQVTAAGLTAAWGRDVAGVNGGVSGYTSAQSLALLEQLGPEIAPKWVVVASMWSDLYRRDVATAPKAWGEQSALYRVLREGLGPHLRPGKVGWLTGRDDVRDASRARSPIAAYAGNLRAIVDWCTKHNAVPVFLMLPAPMDLDLVPPPDAVLDYREVMRQVAREAGTVAVDSPAWFRSHNATPSMFLDQVHPNAVGHYLIAEALTDALVRQNIPPSPAP